VNFNNLKLYEYFDVNSLKQVDVQYDLKLENAGDPSYNFTKEQHDIFLRNAKILLENNKRMLYLFSEPVTDHEKEKSVIDAKPKGRPQREPDDTLTKLTQEQTALLIHYLREGKLILKGDYLNNKQAGEAFSLLTGYSSETLRQKLGEKELTRIKNKKNLDELINGMTRIKLLMEKEFKTKK
jgi:hypothetical protein